MEQAQKARDLKQAEAWEEKVAADVVEVVVSRQALADSAPARTVVNRYHTNWEFPAMNSNALSVGRL